MKRSLLLLIVVFFCGAVLPTHAEAPTLVAQKSSAPPPLNAEAAKAITMVTGVAISPLLGMGAVGAYEFVTTPKEKRADMPWYTSPLFWLPALLLVAAVAGKDALGTALPPGLKKPLDVAETVENKVNGLVAVGLFVPIAAAIFSSHSGGATASAAAHLNAASMLGVNFAPLLNILTVPLAIAVFVVVWLASHAINILILISPFGAVDAALKSARTFLLGLLTAVHFINPWLGVLLSLVIIVIAYFIAGWSFRLTVFGSVFIWDFITGGRRRFTPSSAANWMFTARRINKVPIRTFGKLTRDESGALTLKYRPLLFLPPRTLKLPEGKYAVGRGLFYPELLRVEGDKTKNLLAMPPRYKTHEEEIARIYSITDVRDTGLLKGIKAIWRWFTRSLFGRDSKEAAVAT